MEPQARRWDLGYLGTYSIDRQPPLDQLMLDSARCWTEGRFIVAGSQYPDGISWPANVQRINHLPPCEHRDFYNSQAFTLNITRADMIRRGYSPSVRLFEAAACGTPIVSDCWPGIETFFEPDSEILLARNADDVLRYLRDTPDEIRRHIGENAPCRVLSAHTAAHRAAQLEQYVLERADRLLA